MIHRIISFLLKSSVIIFLLSSLVFVITFFFIKEGNTFNKRLKLLDQKKWQVSEEVEIYWSETALPYIYAKNDSDLFYATGALQGFLRLGQLEILRHLSQGKLSELIGRKGNDLDIFIRTVDFSRTVEETLSYADEEEMMVIKSFTKGLNDYIKYNKSIPLDLRILGISKIKTWSEKDLLTLHKFLSSDVNWTVLPKFLKIFKEKDFSGFWKNWVLEENLFISDLKESFLDEGVFNKSLEAGSNAFVIKKERTQSQLAPIVAGDPHLGLILPNLWLLMGQFSPSFNSLGVYMPSLPVAVMGRNKDIAWTGTNMWGVSSYLFKLNEEEKESITSRKEIIKTRFGKDKTVFIRESKKGPIISDTAIFNYGEPLALYWSGSHFSKELKSFLNANKSKSVFEFLDSFDDYGESALNFLVADKKNNIARIHVMKQPILNDFKQRKVIQDENNFVLKFKTVKDFKRLLNPEENLIVSANNLNPELKPSPMWFNPPDHRKNRITSLLIESERIGVEDIRKIQTDIYLKTSEQMVNLWLKGYEVKDLSEVMLILSKWNFTYDEKLREPFIFEEMAVYFAKLVLSKNSLSNSQITNLLSHSSWKKKTITSFKKLSEENKLEVLSKLKLFSKLIDLNTKWGDVHKLNLSHPVAKIPLIGRYFTFYDGPYSGGNETVFKAAHKSGLGDYKTSFGANLRLIYDLSKEDSNYLCLLGGQDGEVKSRHSFDQFSKWRKGEYFKTYFKKESVIKNSIYKSKMTSI